MERECVKLKQDHTVHRRTCECVTQGCGLAMGWLKNELDQSMNQSKTARCPDPRCTRYTSDKEVLTI